MRPQPAPLASRCPCDSARKIGARGGARPRRESGNRPSAPRRRPLHTRSTRARPPNCNPHAHGSPRTPHSQTPTHQHNAEDRPRPRRRVRLGVRRPRRDAPRDEDQHGDHRAGDARGGGRRRGRGAPGAARLGHRAGHARGHHGPLWLLRPALAVRGQVRAAPQVLPRGRAQARARRHARGRGLPRRGELPPALRRRHRRAVVRRVPADAAPDLLARRRPLRGHRRDLLRLHLRVALRGQPLDAQERPRPRRLRVRPRGPLPGGRRGAARHAEQGAQQRPPRHDRHGRHGRPGARLRRQALLETPPPV
mmetsp:Transcript_8432/g.28891  ORF Transcript_8432/g.28891 Transcript_8432/m.28891 type:complete len:308 (-) Transcript_8432:22-945(-)